VIDCEATELRRFDIVRYAAHIRAHRGDVAYDGEPVGCTKEPSTADSAGKSTESIVAVLEAAARLRPCPGYINGHDYQEWYTEAKPDLLLALAELARTQNGRQLADRLEQLSKPLCMEPLDAVLSYDALSRPRVCLANCTSLSGPRTSGAAHGPARNGSVALCPSRAMTDARSTPRTADPSKATVRSATGLTVASPSIGRRQRPTRG
jgi:hypothetical protein